MESIYFLGGELWLKNRIISVCCLHGVVTTVSAAEGGSLKVVLG